MMRRPGLFICSSLFCSNLIWSAAPLSAQGPGATSQPDANVRIVSVTGTECIPGNRHIHELTPQLAFNDFNGRGQTVAAFVYSYSQCMGESRHRWFVNASTTHVDEQGFSASSYLVGGGLELHPLDSEPNLAILPAIRIGREDFRPGPAATLVSAAMTVIDVHPLSFQTRTIAGRDVEISASQLEWALRTEYSARDFSGPAIPGRDEESLTFFGSLGLDSALGRSNWRWKAAAAYQTLPGTRDGFASLTLSFRIVDDAYVNYDWNFAVSGQAGDGDFTGILFSISRRFGR